MTKAMVWGWDLMVRVQIVFLFACWVQLASCAETPLASESEKKDFIALVRTLPIQGEFFAEASVKRAGPLLRVLLAITEKDIADNKLDVYPFLALSTQLSDTKEYRDFALKNFDKIAHSDLRTFWGFNLFSKKEATPEIRKYLKERLPRLREMLGPGFEEFNKALISE